MNIIQVHYRTMLSKLRSDPLIDIKSDIGAFQGSISVAAHMLAQTATGCLSYVKGIATLSRLTSFGWIHPQQQSLSDN